MDSHESKDKSNHGESKDGTKKHGKLKSSWGLSTAAHSVGFVAKKVNNKITDNLWHSKKNTSSSSVPSDTRPPPSSSSSSSSISNAKREIQSHEGADSYKFKSSVNIANEEPESENTTGFDVINRSENLKPPDGSNINDESENLKPHDGSNVRLFGQHRWPSSNVVDHFRSSKPQDNSHVRPVTQQRWPNATSSNLVDHSENSKHPDASFGKLLNQHMWPSTVGSNVLNKNSNQHDEVTMDPNLKRTSLQNFASKPSQESSSDATNISSSSSDSGRFKIDKSTESQPSSPNKSYSSSSRGANPTPTPSIAPVPGVSSSRARRGASLIPTKKINPLRLVRGISVTPSGKGANQTPSSRGASPTHTLTPATGEVDPTPTDVGSSPTSTSRPSSPPLDFHTLPSSPSSRGASPTPSDRETSPGPPDIDTSSIHIARGASHRIKNVNPIKMTGTRHFLKANIVSIFTKIGDKQKEKNEANHMEDYSYLELLHTIQVQWQFANASAEAALDLQRVTAEKSLFDVWKTILQLRDSIAEKKIDLALLILQLKLYALLYRQMSYIDEWDSINKEYESALSITTNDLQTRSLSVPIIGGIKADIEAMKVAIFSSLQVLQASVACIHSSMSKLEKTHFLASEVANVALHERALIDECEIFLASAAPLHIEECSLRSYLIQSNRTSMTE